MAAVTWGEQAVMKIAVEASPTESLISGPIPLWTLITVTYNSSVPLREYWAGITLPQNVEWVVVDNASNDESAEVARSLGARVISLSQNVGFAAANNLGLEQSQSKFVGFINPDVRISTTSLIAFAELLSKEEVVVAPQLHNPDGTLQPNARGLPTLARKIANRLPLSKRLRGRYQMFASPGSAVAVPWVTGAAILARRSTMDNLGGWDTHFFLYHEDSDLCLRSWRAGVPVRVIGSEKWVHGWARDTASLQILPWIREFSSMKKFYTRYPRLLWSFEGAGEERHIRKILKQHHSAELIDWSVSSAAYTQ